jgi:glycosyltransferase involved in cell wall biosynthesis
MNQKTPRLNLSHYPSFDLPVVWITGFRLFLLRIRQWLEFDSSLLKELLAHAGLFLSVLFYKTERSKKAVGIWSKIHSSACSPSIINSVTGLVRSAIANDKTELPRAFHELFREHVESLRPTPRTEKFFSDPRKMLGPMAIVLKSRKVGEKGVVSILYSYALPLFAKLFDVQKITEDYFLVLEPSWSGYCSLDILCYSSLRSPVFVQAYEPRDSEFIGNLNSNLIPTPVSNNWWVDHRIFRPLADATKDVDVIMVAGWANFKQHHEFFRALARLRKTGVRLRTVIIGYPMSQTRDDVCQRAKYYGILDQLEIYESITPDEINHHLNRAKVNIIWSRKEGVNRAIIEGLFAGTPCILRKGFNYGYHYPYMNTSTGCYSAQSDLPERLLWMIDNYRSFSPRDWVLKHMSCEVATAILSESIKTVACSSGQNWTEDIVAKVNGLDGMQYWNPEEKRKFDEDYSYLGSCVRGVK